jgi:peptidoglycan/xylan/chitin deacetylase (PgdA/CDA1 family)
MTSSPLGMLRAPARAAVRGGIAALGPPLERLVPPVRAWLARGLTVFIFHEVTSVPSLFHRTANTYTSPDVFLRQLSWITARFTVIEPARLRALGGSGELPHNAALLTFDDCWAGTFRVAVPLLQQLALPALCFLNMGTIRGDPDLVAVRAYELHQAAPHPNHIFPGEAEAPGVQINVDHGDELVSRARKRYGSDQAFLTYQGPTATESDLRKAERSGSISFGSHLYHHWDVRDVADDLYEAALVRNSRALAEFSHSLRAFAIPHGYAGQGERDPFTVPFRLGTRVIFTGSGYQNNDPGRQVLDRAFFPAEPSPIRYWWYATHRKRLLGRRAN